MNKRRLQSFVRRHLTIAALILLSGHAAKDSAKIVPEASLQLGHMQTVTAIAIAKDQNVLASGDDAGRVLLWDLKSGRQLRRLSGYAGPIASLAFGSGGNLLASSDSQGTVKVWESSTGIQRASLQICPTLTNALAFDPVRLRIMVACSAIAFGTAPSHGEIAVWDFESSSVRRIACQQDCTATAFTKDGEMAALGMNKGAIELWKTNTWEKIGEIPNSGGEVKTIAFSDDTSKLLLRTSQRLREWDRGRHEFTEDYQLRTIATSYLTDGSIFAAIPSTGDIIQLSQLYRGNRRDLWSWKEEFSVKTLVLDAESNVCAAGGSLRNQDRGSVAAWNLQTGSPLPRLAGHVLSSRASRIAGDKLISATEEGTVHLWDLRTARETDRSTRHANNIPTITTSRLGNLLATADVSGLVSLWEVTSDSKLRWAKSYSTSSYAAALSEKGDWLAIGQAEHENVVRVIHLQDGQELTLSDNPKFVSALAFNSSGSKLASGSYDGSVVIWDASKGWTVKRTAGHAEWVLALAFSDVSDLLLTGGRDQFVKLWDSSTGRLKQSWKVPDEVTSVAFSPDGKIAAASVGNKIYLWNAITGESMDTAFTDAVLIAGLTFRGDGTALYGVSSDGPLIAWRVVANRLHEAGRLLPEQSGVSTSISSTGQFDSTNLEDIRAFSWVFPDAPFRALAPEVFMRDYYEPRLIARLMSGESLKEARSLASLNRAQPEVGKPEIVWEAGAEGLVLVRVHVQSTTSETQRDADGKPRRSGAYDLRLFRDGQMVGQRPLMVGPEPVVGPDASDAEGSAWQKRHVIVDSHAEAAETTVEIPHVKLPRRAGQKEVVFSAYAFNEDRVKSTTASKSVSLPADWKPRRGKAYVISVGVNRTLSTPAWDLSYAVNDARALSRVVSRKLRDTKQFADVVPVCLISEDPRAAVKNEDRCDTELPATRQSLQAVLDRLAGRPVNEPIRTQLEKIAEKAQPEDLVLISVSSHGYTDDRGTFHFVTADVNEAQRVTPALDRSTLNTDQLSAWLREVDAGELVLIVDACQSEATIQSEGFKPGPMGSRGLGQLAYDKGMRVLAASKARESAYERDKIGHGLLSYALVTKGLEEGEADWQPKDHRITMSEWLSYAEQEVPKLFAEGEAKGGVQRKGAPAGTRDVYHGKKTTPDRYQQPTLFNFAKGHDIDIATIQDGRQ